MKSLIHTAVVFAFVMLLCRALRGEIQSQIVGDVRLQALSPTLLRLEVKGPQGFEDRPTFHVVNRQWPGTELASSTEGDDVIVHGQMFQVRVPKDAKSLDGVTVQSGDGQVLWTFDGKLQNNVWLPAPNAMHKAWSIADAPRMVRGKQGAAGFVRRGSSRKQRLGSEQRRARCLRLPPHG